VRSQLFVFTPACEQSVADHFETETEDDVLKIFFTRHWESDTATTV